MLNSQPDYETRKLFTHPPASDEPNGERWLREAVHDESCPAQKDDDAKCMCGFENYYLYECEMERLREALEKIEVITLKDTWVDTDPYLPIWKIVREALGTQDPSDD